MYFCTGDHVVDHVVKPSKKKIIQTYLHNAIDFEIEIKCDGNRDWRWVKMGIVLGS